MFPVRRSLVAASLALAAASAPTLHAQSLPEASLAERLARSAPKLDRKVLGLATQALSCSLRSGGHLPPTLSVIDYSRPSTQPRLWVFDLARNRLLFEEWVAHGRNTGENLASKFSNRNGSFMSSLGAFRTQESYVGNNGYSLRLEGLEPGYNDQARSRAIVMHGAPYVSEVLIRQQGRLGRSLGCPAVRPAVAKPIIDTIRGGSFVFAYYPDQDWLRHSRLLAADCGGSGGVPASSTASVHASP